MFNFVFVDVRVLKMFDSMVVVVEMNQGCRVLNFSSINQRTCEEHEKSLERFRQVEDSVLYISM